MSVRLEADAGALLRGTGFRPAVSFEEGAKQTADWMRREV